MPVRQLRRLGPAVGDSLFDQLKSSTLNSLYWRPYVDAVERDHPELIVRDGANILMAEGHGGAKLLYAFENERVMVDRFPAMFEKLLPHLRRALRSDSVRLRLGYAPARPLIEPMLKQLWFRPSRAYQRSDGGSWMEFSLPRAAKLPAAPAPRGVRFRDGGVDDVPELLRIDREAFPDTPILPGTMRTRLQEEESVIVAMAGKEIAGFCLYSMPESGAGYINVLAVGEAHRGRGIGAGLTVRAAKRLFAEGARDVGLTTADGNGPAIRLYVRLGFKQTRAGRDYSRPTDPREIEAMKAAGEGTLIRFGGWR